MSELITAKIKSVNVQNTRGGDAGINIVCEYPDGSKHGKKIYQWIWRAGNTTDPNLLKWAQFAEPECTEAEAIDVLISGKMSDLEIDLLVDKESDERFWKILSAGIVGTLVQDDIPF